MDDDAELIRALDRTTAALVGVVPAAEVAQAVGRRAYLHSGPPIGLGELPGPMRAALNGALVFEGEAESIAEANDIIDSGDFAISPCHDSAGVGAMAGVVTPNMPVVVVRTEAGREAFSPVNEGLGSALRFGSTSEEVLVRLKWLREAFMPLVDRAIRASDAIELTSLQGEGLRRGDECHNRNVACTAALVALLAPNLVRNAKPGEDPARLIEWASTNPHFFLPFSMAASKATADTAHAVGRGPLVTAMAGNGIRFGIRVAGLGDQWFTAPAPVGTPKLFEGFRIEDAQPAMGDSYITETVGLGAFALSASPAITSFIGGDPRKSSETVEAMREITMTTSSRFLIPQEGFVGTPLGIDVIRVADTRIAPAVNNGLASRRPGVGQVGAGLTRLPIEPFLEAAAAYRQEQAPSDEGGK